MIMAVIAYLRVSTEKQYLENQHEEIERFASKHGLKIDRWYTETVSGCVCSKDRKLANLLLLPLSLLYLATILKMLM